MFEKVFKPIKDFFTITKERGQDKFQIRVVTLLDGSKLYYPQYKSRNALSQWATIIYVNGFAYKTLGELDDNDPETAVRSEELALQYIERYKEKLALSRAKQVEDEDIIELSV